MSIRKSSFRLSLYIGVALCSSLPAQAQQTFDPFAPNMLAPTEPLAPPTVHIPVVPTPIHTAPPPTTPVEIPALPVAQPASTPVVSAPTLAALPQGNGATPTAEPSLFDNLDALFSDEKKITEKPPKHVQSPPKSKTTEQVDTGRLRIENNRSPQKNIVPNKPAAGPLPYAMQAPKPYLVPANPQSNDPFAASSVAPSLPSQAPRALIAPVLAEKSGPPSQPPILSAPKVTIEGKSPRENTLHIEHASSQETPVESSFFDRLSDIFGTPETTPVPVEKTALKSVEKDSQAPAYSLEKLEETQNAQSSGPYKLDDIINRLFKSNEVPVSAPAPVLAETEPVQVPLIAEEMARVEIPEPATTPKIAPQKAKPSLGEMLSNFFNSPDEEQHLVEEKPILSQLQKIPKQPSYPALKQASAKEPFAPQALAPTTPSDPPKISEPVIKEEAVETQKKQPRPSFFDKVGDLFKSKEETPRALPETPVQHSKPAPIEIVKQSTQSPDLFEKLGDFFGKTLSPSQEKNKPLQPAPAPKEEKTIVKPSSVEKVLPPKQAPLDPRLLKAELGLGRLIKLGQGDDDLSTQAKCFTKNRGTAAFCLTPTKWPATINQHFDVSSNLYKGMQGIVQFDGNIATRLLALFNTSGFEDIIQHYENELGPATKLFARKTRTIRKGNIDNPVYLWRKENKEEGLVEVFEIRKIADMRGGLPDLKRGLIRVYFEGSREIFTRTSPLDFMDLR